MSICKPCAAVAVVVILAGGGAAAQHKPTDAPVDYSATAQDVGAMGAVATSLKIHVDRYTAEKDRTALVAALTKDGYQAFLAAFRKAPVVGYVQIKDRKWDLRWARYEKTAQGLSLTMATDQPIYFVGAGSPDAKPREGYEMAIIRLDVDDIGMGKGSFAAAARVKLSADKQGVDVDDYAGKPLPITTVTRIFS